MVSQVVLSDVCKKFDIKINTLFASHPDLLSPVLQVINRAISTFLIKQAGLKRTEAQTGAVTLIQRFGSAANLNIHLHCLFLDGVYRVDGDVPVFQPVPTPTNEQLRILLSRIVKRIMKLLTRKGYLLEEEGMIYMAEIEPNTALAPLQSAACTYRIALGPRAGQKVLTLNTVPIAKIQESLQSSKCCVNTQGFSLHAEVRCGMNQRHKLERLCRYITRPAIANERLKRNSAGDAVLQLKSPYRDGTTHIVLSPLEFMQRLATLVPRPRLNLIRFHGILAPNAKHRSEIIPDAQKIEKKTSDAQDEVPHSSASVRISWGRLLKRVFDIDIEHCPHCGGELKIIAAIQEPRVIARILDHLGLPTRAPPRSPAQSFELFDIA